MYGAIIVDLIAFLTCKRATSVNGMLRTYARQTEHINGHRLITSDDFCSFQMELNDDACATVTVNGNVPGPYYQEVLAAFVSVCCGSYIEWKVQNTYNQIV